MKHIFRWLSHYLWAVLLVIALLVAQAYFDLSLPNLTSDLLNVGLQQGGHRIFPHQAQGAPGQADLLSGSYVAEYHGCKGHGCEAGGAETQGAQERGEAKEAFHGLDV